MPNRHRVLAASLLLGCLFAGVPAAAATPTPMGLQGTFIVVRGDAPPGQHLVPGERFFIAAETGSTEVALPAELVRALGGLGRLDRQPVEAVLDLAGGPPVVRFLRLTAAEASRSALGGVSGSQPWVTLACKFSDIAAEPKALSYFQDMYGGGTPRLDHYWRELSYDQANVLGSTAAGWFVLPHAQSFYVPTPGSGTSANLTALFNDCTAAADPFVNFATAGGYQGINLMFNGLLDCCAWGGGHFATLDGIGKTWRTTWDPPWAFENINVTCHEMGHGFGLPHSNNADDDGWPYDNPWDVMSDSWGYAATDPGFGTIGKHTISAHMDQLGWVPAGQRLDATADGSWTITLDPLAPATASHYRMAHIAISGGRYYTVEVRSRPAPYDVNLPGSAVILHEVNPLRSEPAWLVDPTAADGGDGEGGMWRLGECFEDSAEAVRVCVDAQAGESFVVSIIKGLGVPLFADGFETGNTAAWSLTVP